MNFVDKENIAGLQISHERGNIPSFLKYGAGGGFQ